MTQPKDHHPDPDQFPDYPGQQPHSRPAYNPQVTPQEATPPSPPNPPPSRLRPPNITSGPLLAMTIVAAGAIISLTVIAAGAIGYIIATTGNDPAPPETTAALTQPAPVVAIPPDLPPANQVVPYVPDDTGATATKQRPPAPHFVATTMNGDHFDIAAATGSPTLIVFWSHW